MKMKWVIGLYTATLIIAKAIIPAPFFNGVNSSRNPDPVPAKAGNHYFRNTGFPRIKYGAGSVEPGMTNRIRLMSSCIVLLIILSGGSLLAQESQEPLTIEESIKIALEQSLNLHSAMVGVKGSEFRQNESVTNFLPQWKGQYSYTRYDTATTVGSSGSKGVSRDVYTVNTTINQPLFTGGSNLANYRFQKMGVDFSKTAVDSLKLDIVLHVREGYFNILKAMKLLDVAQQNVKQFEAQLDVANAFFKVGIVAKNDVLQAEVKLAQARQDLVKAENGLAIAKASFNNLLRREINAPLEVVDILKYKPSMLRLEDSFEQALRQRPEIRAAGLNIDQAKENVKIARSGFFPVVSLTGNYARSADEIDLQGNLHSDRWTIQALATFTIFDWGNTYYKVAENKVRVTQAEDLKKLVIDGIVFEVKQNYLSMVQAENNIAVAEKAIEQAEENLRMNQERYKYQVATATDVLDAVTLLTQARTNYYTALGDYNIAKANIDRAMGIMYL